MSINASDLGDLITTTQKELGELRYTDLSSDLQYHVALSKLFQESSVTYEAGPSIQWNLMTENSGAAKQTGLFAVDDLNISDVMTTAEIGWKHSTVNYAIERREIAMNSDPRKIVDLVKVRRNDAMISLTEHLETQFWSKPANDASQDMHGVGYWISDAEGMTQDGLSAGEFGFKGGHASGFTKVAGIDPADTPRWQNGLGEFAASDVSDPIGAFKTTVSGATQVNEAMGQPGILDVMKEAYVKCNFRPMPNASYPSYNPSPERWGIYCGYNTLSALEIMQNRLNDRIVSRDVATDANGVTTFRGVPIEHTVFTTHVDLTMNLQCIDRRRNALLCSGAVALS